MGPETELKLETPTCLIRALRGLPWPPRCLGGGSTRGRGLGLALALALAISTACSEGFNGAEQPYDVLLDYTVDRPRVMGLSLWPLEIRGGETLTLEALAATPDCLRGARVEWWGCGVTFDRPVQNIGSDCYGTDLVEYLGEGAVFSLQLPDYDISGCEEQFSCYSSAPLFAVVRGDSGKTSDEGYAVTYLEPDLSELYSPAINDLYQAPITFRVGEGQPIAASNSTSATLSATASAAPGGEVALEARVESHTDYDLYFSWYVSAGELEQFGFTRAASLEFGQSGQPNVLYGRNTLRIPEDFAGSSIAIYLVIDVVLPITGDYGYAGYSAQRFATGTVEVSR